MPQFCAEQCFFLAPSDKMNIVFNCHIYFCLTKLLVIFYTIHVQCSQNVLQQDHYHTKDGKQDVIKKIENSQNFCGGFIVCYIFLPKI